MSLLIYADFTDLPCYLASRRVDALRATGVEVDWRAVETDPAAPARGRPADLEDVADLLLPGETLPYRPTGSVPNTRAAVSAYAEGVGAGVGDDIRRILFTARWQEGADIGNPEMLRTRLAGAILRGSSTSWPLQEAGYAVSVSGGPITSAAWRRIRDWRDEWTRLGTGAALTLVADDGLPVTGTTALRRLEKELLAADADPEPVLPDPTRYPTSRDRPDRQWVAEIGGYWSHAWKRAA